MDALRAAVFFQPLLQLIYPVVNLKNKIKKKETGGRIIELKVKMMQWKASDQVEIISLIVVV